MQQIFLLIGEDGEPHFDKMDGLPVSAQLLPHLLTYFPQVLKNNKRFEFNFRAADARTFLKIFYAQYELSQPQRRIWLRFEKVLSGLSSRCEVQFVTAEVSEHRNRRDLKEIRKKTEQLY